MLLGGAILANKEWTLLALKTIVRIRLGPTMYQGLSEFKVMKIATGWLFFVMLSSHGDVM